MRAATGALTFTPKEAALILERLQNFSEFRSSEIDERRKGWGRKCRCVTQMSGTLGVVSKHVVHCATLGKRRMGG